MLLEKHIERDDSGFADLLPSRFETCESNERMRQATRLGKQGSRSRGSWWINRVFKTYVGGLAGLLVGRLVLSVLVVLVVGVAGAQVADVTLA